MGIFDFYGIAVNPRDMRALGPLELAERQQAQASAMQQAAPQPYEYLALMNWVWDKRPEEKPLDERFADFKLRLAAAVERLKKS